LHLLFFVHLAHARTRSSSTPSSTSATLLQIDSTTAGNWSGVYGSDGYALDSNTQSIPSYAQWSVTNAMDWIWNPDTVDPRALQIGGGAGFASAWYSSSSFAFNVNFTDGASHQIALYLLDWDGEGRAETIQILDAQTNAVLNTQTIANFTQGEYVVFNVSGRVTINVSTVAGPNAVVSGIFFAPGVAGTSAQSLSSTSTATVSSSSQSLVAGLTASASALSFGAVGVSQSSTQLATLTNTGTGNLTVSNVVVSGAGFSVSGLSVGTILAPGQSAVLTVTFDPASSGTLTGSVVIATDSGTDTIVLTGTGGAQQHQVNLSWAASSSPNIVGYNTYFSTVSGGPYARLTASPVAATSYVDASVTSGMTRYYVITAVDSSYDESGYSAEVAATVP
jgi:hypothetical protein